MLALAQKDLSKQNIVEPIHDLNKDIIILKLLIGWEIIHLSKNGKKVVIRLRDFPEKPNMFLSATFSKCDLAVVLDFNNGQIDNFDLFEFKGCVFDNINLEYEHIINIHLLRGHELVGALKIKSHAISFNFTTR